MRRLLPIVALLVGLLDPKTGLAVWTDVGNFASDAEASATTPHTILASAALEAGNVGVCVVGHDESTAGTADGDNDNSQAVTDESGNTWVRVGEHCNMQTSAVQNGACVAAYYTRATTTLDIGDDLIFQYVLNVAAHGIVCREFSITAGGSVSATAGTSIEVVDAGDPGSMTVATGVAREHLFIRATALEHNGTITEDADYTGTGVEYDSTVAGTSMKAHMSFRIASEASAAANDLSNSGTSDNASLMFGLNEDPGAGWTVQVLQTD